MFEITDVILLVTNQKKIPTPKLVMELSYCFSFGRSVCEVQEIFLGLFVWRFFGSYLGMSCVLCHSRVDATFLKGVTDPKMVVCRGCPTPGPLNKPSNDRMSYAVDIYGVM